MAEIDGNLELQAWCFGFPGSGGSGGHTLMRSYFSC